MVKKIIAIILLLLVFIPGIASCQTPAATSGASGSPNTSETTFSLPPGADLAFEKFSFDFTQKNANSPDKPQIDTMVNSQSPIPDVFSSLDVGAFDFSKYFVLFVFMGLQSNSGPEITIQKIRQARDTIFVQTFFDKDGPTYVPLLSSPCQIVKVNKEDMSQFGSIKFILLDQDGNERATNSYIVSE